MNGAKYETVSVSGFGQNGSLSISGNDDTLSILNCNITSLSINGDEQVIYVISAYAGTGGTITPEGDSIVAAGGDITYTITPDPGYAIASVRLDSVEMGSIDEFTFRNVNQAHTIAAQFIHTAAIINAGYNSANGTVDVTYQYDGAARVVCALDGDGSMIRCAVRTVSAGETSARLSLSGTQLPSEWKMKIMLTDASWKPLCPAYELRRE